MTIYSRRPRAFFPLHLGSPPLGHSRTLYRNGHRPTRQCYRASFLHHSVFYTFRALSNRFSTASFLNHSGTPERYTETATDQPDNVIGHPSFITQFSTPLGHSPTDCPQPPSFISNRCSTASFLNHSGCTPLGHSPTYFPQPPSFITQAVHL